ncbi:hypothetical protein FJZ19_00475 [Candidatus Pacearchaeota archaeon]|nr:hypothetical protein [Candidatus Pacearchaeota archaeon]
MPNTDTRISRRNLLQYGGMILAGLAVMGIPIAGELYIDSHTPEREKKITKIQDAVDKLNRHGKINYVPNFGYGFDLSLDGRLVRANISRQEFNRGHKLSYQPEGTDFIVRVYGKQIEVSKFGERVYDSKIEQDMQAMTDRVLDALVAQTSPER